MTKEMQSLVFVGLVLLWLGLISGACVFLFYRYPKRRAVAAAVGAATTLVALVGMLAGLAPSDVRACGFALMLGVFFFLTSLFWLWLTPVLQGKSWDEFLSSITEEIERSRKRRHG